MLSRSQSSRVTALHHRRGREDSGEFLVEGVRFVEDMLASPIVPRLALVSPSLEDTSRGSSLARRVRDAVTTVDVTDAELARLATTETTQGIIVVATIPRVGPADVRLGADAFVVVLDAVQDPGNFGSIARSADAFGAACLVTLPGTVDPWNPKSVRAAAGSSLRVPIVETTLDELVPWVRAHGGELVGADMDGENAEHERAHGVIALLLGNEGNGLSDDARAACDRMVSVITRGGAESLNVGVAAGILMYMLAGRT